MDAVKTKRGRFQHTLWMKPTIVVLLSFLFFATTIQTTGSLVSYDQSTSSEKNVEAAWYDFIGDAAETVGGWISDAVGTSASEAITSGDFDGQEWVITPKGASETANFNKAGAGAMSKNGPFGSVFMENKDNKSGMTNFMAFQYWASQYGVYSDYDLMSNIVGVAMNAMGRIIGGSLLLAVTLLSHLVEFLGDMVYQAIDTFNIFKYITPDGDILGEWSYNATDNPIMSYFADWLNLGRFFGYMLALILFVLGLALSVLGVRIGRSQSMGGSVVNTLKRLFISVFALTGAVLMLSGIITTFAERMQANYDGFGADSEISGLILNYKGYVTANYLYDPGIVEDYKNESWNIDSGNVASLKEMEKAYTHDTKLASFHKARTVSVSDIKAMNAYSSSVDATDEGAPHGIDAVRTLFDSKAMQSVMGWMTSDVTSSKEMMSTYGETSMPYAIYRVKTDKMGIMSVEDSSLFSTRFKFYDYTIPGGIAGFFRTLGVIARLGLVTAFAAYIYWTMFLSIMTMVQRSLVQLPAAIGLGTASGLFLLFGTVVTMMVELVIARMIISLFIDVLGATQLIFPILSDVLGDSGVVGSAGGMLMDQSSTGLFNMGTIFPFAAGTEAVGEIALSVIVMTVLGVLLFKTFRNMNAKLGSSVDNFFVDLSTRIAGVRPGDMSRNPLMGGKGSGAGGFETTTTTESESSSTIGSYSDSEAIQNGLGGSIIGGIGDSGASMGSTGGFSTDGFGVDPQDDSAIGSISPESALSNVDSAAMSNEEAFGAVGNADGMEEETDVTESSASGSSTSGNADSSPLSDNVSSDTDVSDNEDAAFGSIGDSESESSRHHTDRVSADQEIDAGDMDGYEGAFGQGDEDMNNDRTIGATDHVSVNVDQELDAAETADALADYQQQQSADQRVEGDDATMYQSAGDMAVEMDTGSSDASTQGFDESGTAGMMDDIDGYDTEQSVAGDDSVMRYAVDPGEETVEMTGEDANSTNAMDMDDYATGEQSYDASDESSADSDIDGTLLRTIDGADTEVGVDSEYDEGSFSYDESDAYRTDMNDAVPDVSAAYDAEPASDFTAGEEHVSMDTDATQDFVQVYDENGTLSREQRAEQGSQNTNVANEQYGEETGFDYDSGDGYATDVNSYLTDEDESSTASVDRDVSGSDTTSYRIDTTGNMEQVSAYETGSQNAQISSSNDDYDQSFTPGFEDADTPASLAEDVSGSSTDSVTDSVSGVYANTVQRNQDGSMDYQESVAQDTDDLSGQPIASSTFQRTTRPIDDYMGTDETEHSSIYSTATDAYTDDVSGVIDQHTDVYQTGDVDTRESVDYHSGAQSTPSFGRVDAGSMDSAQDPVQAVDTESYEVGEATPYSASNDTWTDDSDSGTIGAQQQMRRREARVEASESKTTTTTTTKYTPSGNTGGGSGYGRASSYGTDIDGGYIDHQGKFHRVSGSPLSGDVSGYFGGGETDDGLVPEAFRYGKGSPGSQTVERKVKAPRKSRVVERSTEETSLFESTDSVEGFLDGEGFFTGEFNQQGSVETSHRTSESSTTDRPRFGRRE